MGRLMTTIAMVLMGAVSGAAQTDRHVLGPEPAASLEFLARDQATAEATLLDLADVGPAWRVRVAGEPASTWSVMLRRSSTLAVRAGDVLHLRLQARRLGDADAWIEAVFERAGEPYEKSLVRQLLLTPSWQTFDLPFAARHDLAAGEAQFTLRLGFPDQQVEIAAVSLLNLGPDVDLKSLPATPVTYAGRAPDAPWRARAWQRIDEHRKQGLRVRVVDAAGRPLPGAEVRLRLTRHAFRLGTAVTTGMILGEGPDAEAYRAFLLRRFNEVVFENDLKWPQLHDAGYDRTDKAVQWLRDHGFTVRGHVLLWPSQRYVPRHVAALESDPSALAAEIDRHLRRTAGFFNRRLVEWDVVNEPFANHWLMDVLGPQAMPGWFAVARQADPAARLFINDYDILASGNRLDTAHQRHFHDAIRGLLDAGAPLGGIGMQGHFGGTPTDPERLWIILDRFAAFGLPIKVTELDIEVGDDALHADYLRDFIIACLAHPQVSGILQWGFWEGRHWKPHAALLRRDFTPRPAGQAFIDLLDGPLATDVRLVSDADGVAAARGFKGAYEITVRAGGGEVRLTADVGDEPFAIDVGIPTP